MAAYDSDFLQRQVMVNTFVNAVGCTTDQAQQMLQSAQWRLEVAYSMFFDEPPVGVNNGISIGNMAYSQRVPNNTPATPSQLPDILSSLSQMTTNSESMERSHGQWMDRRERCSSGAELGELLMYQDQSSNQTQSLVVPGMHPELPPQEMSDPQSVYEPSQPPQQQPPVQPYSFYGQAPNVTSSS